MIDLKRPINDLAGEVQSGKLSATDLLAASLARIAETDEYHALLELNPEAHAQAQAVDARVAAGEVLPLAGIPYVAKDLFLTSGTHTTAASNILNNFTAPFEGPAVSRLKAAGAVLVAKANLDAFAHGSSTENSDFGPTKNPYDLSRVAGGSSGGSTATVALGQVPFSIGTDTGGSIRQPASYCGVVGLKPTYGLVPRSGVIAMASSFDTIGPITNSVQDCALVIDVLAGSDPSDATSIDRDPDGYAVKPIKLKGLKVGIIKQYMGEGLDPGIKAKILATAEQLKAAGTVVEEVEFAPISLREGKPPFDRSENRPKR